MSARALMIQHVKETAELKREEKAHWNQLLKDQEATLLNSHDQEQLALLFEKQREEHNEHYTKAKAELMRKQQKDLEAYKEENQHSRSGREQER